MATGSPNISKSLRSRIISGSVVLLSGSSLATAVNLAYNIAVARFLGPQGFGHATAVYTLLTLTSAVTLSFQIVATKVVAQQTSEPERDAAYRDLQRGSWLCGGAVGLALLLFQKPIADYLNLPNSLLVALLAIGVAFYVPLGARRGYIQGAFGFTSLAKSLVVEGLVRLLGSVALIEFGFGVNGVIAANALAIAVAYLLIAPKLTPAVPTPLRARTAFREVTQAMIFYSGQVLINNCDIVLVKHFFSPEVAGLYAAVAMVGRVTFSFSTAVVNSMFPIVAGSRHEDRRGLSLIATAMGLVLAVGMVFAIALRLTPAWIWTRFFGASFVLPGPHGFPYLLALYAITTVIYSLSVVVITYEMSYKIANTSWLQLVFSGLMIVGISRFHASLLQVIMVQLVLMIVLLLSVAVPFLFDSKRNAELIEVAPPRGLSRLRRLSEDEAIAAFVQSEFENAAYRKYQDQLREIVFHPDMDDQLENAKRRALLFLRHRSLWKEIPQSTEWWEVQIEEADLEQIRVFPRAHWRKLAKGKFEVTKIIAGIRELQRAQNDPFVNKITTIRQGLTQPDADFGSVLLIGINELEPLTVLDGNHRFVSAVLEGRLDRLRFICGLSPEMTRCCWYNTNFSTLTRYGRNLMTYVVRRPESELKSLFERPG